MCVCVSVYVYIHIYTHTRSACCDSSRYAELSLLLVAALLTYTVTDSIGLSGILSLFFAGITMRHYTYYNLSPAAQVTTHLSLSMYTSIYIYLDIYLYI